MVLFWFQLNPQHTVPTLVDNSFVIWDSHAIIAYLVGKYGKDDSLYPKNISKRALIDQRLHFDSGILFSYIRQTIVSTLAYLTWLKSIYISNFKTPLLFYGEKEIPTEKLKEIQEAYNIMETYLKNSEYLVGDTLTIADLSCVASVSTCTIITPISAEKHPKLIKWYNKLKSLPYYKEANEEGLNKLDTLIHEALEKRKV